MYMYAKNDKKKNHTHLCVFIRYIFKIARYKYVVMWSYA